MSKNKSSKHKPVSTPSTGAIPSGSAYDALDNLIATLEHTAADETLYSKTSFSTLDKDGLEGLEGLELVFRQAMTKAIKQHDVSQFRKSYVAMERILGIDMENYEGLEWHFPAEGKTANVSPSELCMAFKAWPIVAEVFKLSLAHTGPAIRECIDSPSQLIFRLGSWTIAPELQSELAGITQVANEAVFLFLSELKLISQAQGMDLKPLIQKIPFLKQFPLLEQIFWTQYAALSA